jgi:hypothetical protein
VQGNLIAGAIFFTFFVYITTRGQLPAYLALLGFGTGSATAATTSGTPATSGNAEPLTTPAGSAGIGAAWMQIALILIGVLLLATGVQGTQGSLASQLASDFGTGSGSFWYFIVGIFAVGALGYYQPFGGASKWLLALVILVLLVANEGFFTQLQAALSQPLPASPVAPALPVPQAGAAVASTLNTANTAAQSAGRAVGQSLGLPDLSTSLPSWWLTPVFPWTASAKISAFGSQGFSW